MKIQKGIVKYKDRNDIVCTYGITDDGKQYYFLGDTNDKKFSNGNRVASTLLVEAIDPMVKASNIGIVDEAGNIVVPFENKSIRLVNDSIIVVEKAEPVSQSVKDAIEMRNDPLSATKLVSTPAAVKDKLYAQMGNDARFVFNDQFSEATICDINGNNLVNNEYYSFIAVANNKLYFSKNTVDSPIAEYSLLPPEVQSNVAPANDENAIDVSNVNVESNVVENAMTETPAVEAPAAESSIADDLNVAKDLGGDAPVVPDIPEVPAIPEVPMVDVPEAPAVEADGGMALPQVEEDVVDAPIEGVAPIAPPVEGEEEDVLMEYDDSLSKVVDETGATEETPADGSAPVEGEEEDVLMEYDDSLSKVVDETGATEEVPAEGAQPVEGEEEDVLMEYDDSLSKVVDETGATEEVPAEGAQPTEGEEEDVLMEYDDSLSKVVDETATTEEAPAEEEDVLMDYDDSLSKIEDETAEEVKFDENVVGDNSTLEDVPPVDSLPPVHEDTEEAAEEEKVEEEEVPEEPKEEEVPQEEVKEEIPEEPKEEAPVEDVPPIVEEEPEDEEPEGGEAVAPTETEELDKDISSVVDEISGDVKKDYDIDSLLNSVEEDDLFTKTVKPDKIDTSLDDFDAFASDYKTGSSDTIMTDIAKSMTELMKQNREQRALLAEYQEKFDVVNAQKKVIAEKYKDQVQKLETVANKYRNLETTASRLETRNQLLESKITEQDRLINAQERELGSLRPQLQGKENLVKILADAKALLGTDDTYI